MRTFDSLKISVAWKMPYPNEDGFVEFDVLSVALAEERMQDAEAKNGKQKAKK